MALSIDLTPAEIRKEGWEALVSKLGVAKSLRFLLEYEKGHGNYTELRKELFAGQTVDDILEGMAKEGEAPRGRNPAKKERSSHRQSTGEICQVAGIYTVINHIEHPKEITVPKGRKFPPCAECTKKV